MDLYLYISISRVRALIVVALPTEPKQVQRHQLSLAFSAGVNPVLPVYPLELKQLKLQFMPKYADINCIDI
jgi:hypothetical protein